MNRTIRTLWHTNRLLVIAFAAALALTLLFGLRAAMLYKHRHPPDGEIEGWMTPGHIVRVYDVDPQIVRDTLGLEPGVRDRRPIARIARDRQVPPEQLIAELEAAIAAARTDAATGGDGTDP